jgi:hypothetical protein
MGLSDDGVLRLTFDRNVRGTLTQDWNVGSLHDGLAVLANQVICEFKYRGAVPTLFKEIIETMRLTPAPVSKYRTFLRACGLVADGSPVHA